MYKQWKVYYSEYYKKTKMKNFYLTSDYWVQFYSQCVPTVCHSVFQQFVTVCHGVSQQWVTAVCPNSVS